jgi:oxygen-independent coproporphyrinogen-3 oxidase
MRIEAGAVVERPGLYVHIPFCLTKCPYCGFYSITDLSLIEAFLDALETEAGFYSATFGAFDSLYLGGGTPSVLNSPQLARLFHILRSSFDFHPDTEVTVEVNPDDVTAHKAEVLALYGVNRVSVGVQSFDESTLAFLGRRHTGAAAHRAIETIKASAITNLGIDLMYGLPGQTRKGWETTLEQALSYEPLHLSCYQLTLEKGTPFATRQTEGRMQVADEKEQADLFLATSRFLERRGFIHYEVSNFARGRASVSRHNSKYWHHVPYLGLGPGAHSFDGRKRSWNHRSVEKYCTACNQGGKPVEGSELLTDEQLRLERLLLGLRTKEGVGLAEGGIRSGPGSPLGRLVQSGLVMVRHGRVLPTRKGFLMADRLPVMLE